MEFLEVTSERCEVFTEANVNSVDRAFNNGRLVKGVFYPIQSDVGTDGVYHWVRIQAGDKKRYAVVLEDRSKIVSLSAGDAITACMAQAPHVDTSELEKKLADMAAEKILSKNASLTLKHTSRRCEDSGMDSSRCNRCFSWFVRDRWGSNH